MKKYSVEIRLYKYSKFKWNEIKIFFAKDREDAKSIAQNFLTSTEWAFDLTPIADLRTVKQLR